MYKYWLFISIFSANFYFTVRAVLGFNSVIEDGNLFYRIYLIAVFMSVLIIFLKQLNIYSNSVSTREILIFVIFGVVLFQFILSGFNNAQFNDDAITFFSYFVIWIIPVCFSAVIILKKNLTLDLLKFLEIYMVLITIGMIRAYVVPSLTGSAVEYYGGATYQTASYLSAFAFGLNLFLINTPLEIRQELYFSKKYLYRLFFVLMLPIQISAVFLSGGRGGGILLIVFVGVYLIKNAIELRTVNIVVGAISIIVLSLTSRMIFNIFNSNITFSQGFNRVFEFVSLSEGINWSGTSNRDQVYLNALSLIDDRLLLGYGLYGVWDYTGYPHNIFLEILLQGGIVYLTICIIFFLYLVWKISKIYENNDIKSFSIIIILLYSLVHLSFSGTYLIHSELWFCVFFLILYKSSSYVKRLTY